MHKVNFIKITSMLRNSLSQFHFLKNNCALATSEDFKTQNLGKQFNTGALPGFRLRDLSSKPSFKGRYLSVIGPLHFQVISIMDNESMF